MLIDFFPLAKSPLTKCEKSIVRQMLTLLRFLAHVLVALVIGMLYWRIGNDASKTYNNAGFLFFNLLFILFASMMPTIVTCESCYNDFQQ